jgi:hypothetical protein
MILNSFIRIRYISTNEIARTLFFALVLSTIFFGSYLFDKNPQLKFFGDLAILYFPQFVRGYHLSLQGAWSGIDFLTGDASSGYFLRPNIPVYYPVYQIVYFLGRFSTIESLARAFVAILCLHSVVATYFCIRIARRYFDLNFKSALLFAVFYVFAVSDSAFTEPPFYYVATLFPIVLYFALNSVRMPTYGNVPFYSIPYLFLFLSGYLPLDVAAVSVAIFFTLAYYLFIVSNDLSLKVTGIIKLFTPFVFASIVVLPLYLAILVYHKQVPGIPEGVWNSAHQFSLESQDIFSLISRSFPATNPGTGAPFIRIGLVAFFVGILAFSQRNKLGLSDFHSRLIAFSLAVFLFFLTLSFGQSSGLPDLFYFNVPVIGKMHLYGRHLIVASFFGFLAISVAFKYFVNVRTSVPIGYWLVGAIITLLSLQVIIKFSGTSWVNLNLLSVEILLLCIMLFSIASKYSVYSYIAVISISFFINASNFNHFINSFHTGSPGPYANDISLSTNRSGALLDYLKINSDKLFIKYIDFTEGIEKPSGLMLNYPWLVGNKINLTNYMGYEPHMSVDKEYMNMFPYPYYGKINIPWIIKTGADFIVADSNTMVKHELLLSDLINKEVAGFDLGNGYRVLKIKEQSRDDSNNVAGVHTVFDNGLIKINSPDRSVSVLNFISDFVKTIKFDIESSSNVSVVFNHFPNKRMVLRVDGSTSGYLNKDGLLEVALSPGKHKLEYVYENRMHSIFLYFISSFTLIIFVMMFYKIYFYSKKYYIESQEGIKK